MKPAESAAHGLGLVRRAFAALEARLERAEHFGGAYSIADIAAYPWIARSDWAGLDLREWPALDAWRDRIASRPAVQAGMAVPKGARLADQRLSGPLRSPH